MKIGLINHGCAKNLIDSELAAGLLIQNGHTITLDETEADIVIINTCSFIHDAEKESVESILEMINENKKVIVTGCLPQKYKKELLTLLPEVKAFLGTSDLNEITEVINNIAAEKTFYKVKDTPLCVYPENIQRQQITVGAYSYLKIAEGCNAECGYCIIPKLRGKLVSRPVEKIIDEAKMLSDKGVAEIVLIAQDTTAYGKDIYGKPSLPDLLEQLIKIENLGRIRIMYAYPSEITDRLLKIIKNSEKIFNYLDIPLQHSSADVLKLMKRPVIDYKKLIDKIRKTIPDITLRTTFITGYPGESEKDFENLKNFVREIKFDRLGVFEYSREKNTYSYNLPNRVPSAVRKKRRNTIMKLQKSITAEINKKLIGNTTECIIEDVFDNGIIIARTYRDAPEVDCVIYLKSEQIPVPGDIVKAKITGICGYDLKGIIL